MAGDPQVFKQAAEPGKMRHTFTGLRQTFPNLGIHVLINRMVQLRKEFFKRTEFLAETSWDDQVLLFIHECCDAVKKEVDQVTYRPAFDLNEPLLSRQAKVKAFRDRAIDKAVSVEDLAMDLESTHSDRMLTAARAVAHSLAFDFTGADADYPQPTPARLPNEAARAFVIGWDYLVVDMTNSNSADAPRTINQHEAAEFIAKLADLYKLASMRGGSVQLPHIPTSLDRSQLDYIWNADGKFDPNLDDRGPIAGEPDRQPANA